MKVCIGALTNPGLVRSRNEDSIAINNRLLINDEKYSLEYQLNGSGKDFVLIIADGMGGHRGGHIASRKTLQELVSLGKNCGNSTDWKNALIAANDRLFEIMEDDPSLRGLGTTVVGIVSTLNDLLYFNVGDSRIYYYSSSRLEMLSHDDVPNFSAKAASKASRTHLITQSLGGHPYPYPIEPHIGLLHYPTVKMRFLLCSDGLTDMVETSRISSCLERFETPMEAAEGLLSQAIESGGLDNVSVVVADFHP